MAEDPEKKYRTNKTLMMETYDRGEIQLMEMTCPSTPLVEFQLFQGDPTCSF